MNRLTICVLLLTVSFNVFSHNVTEQMRQCSLQQNALKRLVCFDIISQNLTPSAKTSVASEQTTVASVEPQKQVMETATPVAVAPPKKSIVTTASVQPPQQSISAKSSTEDFGLKRNARFEESGDSIVANVHSVRKNPFKKYIITLDNGQVWKQFDSTSLRITVGETVIIKRGTLGAFFLGKDGVHKRLRVKRQK